MVRFVHRPDSESSGMQFWIRFRIRFWILFIWIDVSHKNGKTGFKIGSHFESTIERVFPLCCPHFVRRTSPKGWTSYKLDDALLPPNAHEVSKATSGLSAATFSQAQRPERADEQCCSLQQVERVRNAARFSKLKGGQAQTMAAASPSKS